jgi:lipoprotein signal peptidase
MPTSPTAELEEQGSAVRVGEEPAEKASLFKGKIRFWATIVPLVVLDLWSKAQVFAALGATTPDALIQPEPYPVWGGPVHFHLVAWWNTGTIWGLFQDFNLPLTILRFVALGLLIYFAARTPRTARLQLHILGLIFAGALGNLYDNLTQPDGGVRDFLLFFVLREGGEDLKFPAFNVADSCITVGALALIVTLWRSDRAGARDRAKSPAG